MAIPSPALSKLEAQRRADRIAAFRGEAVALHKEGVLSLSAEQRLQVALYHDDLLNGFARQFDVDVNEGEKRLSLGMRIASFLGALALAASAFLFFRRFWGLLGTPAQVAILIAAPLLALAATHFAARREKTGYFASLAGLLTFACFVLDLVMLGTIFNLTPTDNALLLWGACGLLLAYTYDLRLLLAAGLLALGGFLSARTGTWGGCYWLDFGERPENFLPAGLLFFALPLLLPHRRRADFPTFYRLFGLLFLFFPMLVLANWGEGSYLPWPEGRIEAGYQIAGFLLSGAAAALGLRRGWRETVNTGTTFFVVFLFTKLFDWWWDWMPKYLFFLLLGLLAVAVLALLKYLRSLALQREKPA
jgi:uncharacterized membrane protein